MRMQVQYHVSPKTGNAAPCNATQRQCRYSSEKHFETYEGALKSIETKNSHKVFTKLQKKNTSTSDDQLHGTLGPDGFLDIESQEKVKVNGVYCPDCNASLQGLENLKRIGIYGESVTCHKCGNKYDNLNAEVRIEENNPSYNVYCNKNAVTKTPWFHATRINNNDWLESNQRSRNTIHAGTITAALDRGTGEQARIDQDFLIYELEVDESVHVLDDVMEDSEHFSGNIDENECARYVNRWEDIASVSIEVNSQNVRVKSVKRISAQDAQKRLSIFNMPVPPRKNG